MALNHTSIEYVINPDGTRGFNWGIMTGCLHQCRDEYCYNTMKHSSPLNRFFKSNRQKETGELHVVKQGPSYPYGFDPTVYLHRLEDPKHRKRPATIFVANAADIFGNWVPKEVIDSILDVIHQCQQHTFILLTKNFGRLYKFDFPDNCWVGFSQNNSAEVHMQGIKALNKFISFEPLHYGFEYDPRNSSDGFRRIGLHGIQWITIGAESGPRSEQMKPQRDWVMTLIKSAQDRNIHVWMKNNLAPDPFEKSELIQELPWRNNAKAT